MEKIHSAWRRFRALPEILQFGIGLALAILLMLAWPKESRADAIARDGANSVVITLGACQAEDVVKVLRAHGQDPDAYKAARAHVYGKEMNACWQPAPGGAIIVYSDGERDYVDKDQFKPIPVA
jgi:hypothetical protein